jgi:hypothetical protein
VQQGTGGYVRNDCTSYNAYARHYNGGSFNTNYTYGVNNINLTRANAKALGLIDRQDSGYDAYILVSNLGNITQSLSWNHFSATNSSNAIPTSTLDFFSVAVHELTHTLGFISGMDSPEYANLLKTTSNLSGSDMSQYGYLMDMFRLSGNSLNNLGIPDISPGVNTMLSIDSGTSKLADLSSGNTTFGGDGNQGSHWKKDATYDGIMESSLSAGGTRKLVTNNDLTVLDALGWNLKQNNQDLLSIFNSAKSGLAEKVGVATNYWGYLGTSTYISWMDAYPDWIASLLAPTYIDANKNYLDDRGEALNNMVTTSGTYDWGWNGYWWGWNGYWWGWNGYWQNTANLTTDGFWQNFAWETLDEFGDGDHNNLSRSSQAQSVPEPTTIFGLLGMAVFGIAKRLKRHR